MENMIFDKIFGKTKIVFKVNGKPPQKSEWGGKDAPLIIELRKAALKARTKRGLSKCIVTPVKLKLDVYAPNIDDRDYKQTGDDDEKRYIGDLDSLIAGVCDYLSRAPEDPGKNKFVPSPLFDNEPEIAPTIPLIIKDDSQIKTISAKKIISKKTYYVVEVELIS
jgi:Holliday junction resolvase RusA-like endonuclease